MRRFLYIVAFAFILIGQTKASCLIPKTCEELRECLNAPIYYCDCKENSIPFAYGIDTVLTDTTWYTAKLLDIRQGLTAYWFSTGSVDIDIFPLCISDTALLSTTIGKNRAYNVTSDYINEKLQQFGGSSSEAIKNMDVHIRVVPRAGVFGRVVMTSYDEGYHSTCVNPLPVHHNMAYVLSNPNNVYRLDYTSAPKEMAVQWIQKDSKPVRVELAMGVCDAPALAKTCLTDSSHVWLPSLSVLQEAYRQGQPLFFRFATNDNGRIWFVSPLTKYTDRIDTVLCQGMPLQLSDTILTQSTSYTDTLYLSRTDSLLLTTYNLTVTSPITEYDTLSVESDAFPFLYKGQGVVSRYGTFTYLIHSEGECDRRIQLTVQQLIDTKNNVVLLNASVQPTLAFVGQEITVYLEKEALLRVYDMVGNLVLEKWHNGGTSSFALAQTGNYILHLLTQEGQTQTHIVVQ